MTQVVDGQNMFRSSSIWYRYPSTMSYSSQTSVESPNTTNLHRTRLPFRFYGVPCDVILEVNFSLIIESTANQLAKDSIIFQSIRPPSNAENLQTIPLRPRGTRYVLEAFFLQLGSTTTARSDSIGKLVSCNIRPNHLWRRKVQRACHESIMVS